VAGVFLGVEWLAGVGVVVAAVGAVLRLVIAVRKSRLEGQRERAESVRRLRVAPAVIAEIDPTAIGIDRAEQTILPGAGVPDYIPRAADAQLTRVVRDALDGSGPWIVVVHGASKVGKSRSLFEALVECGRATTLELVAPVDADALRSLVIPGHGLRRGRGAAVLCLDDLEPFLNDGTTWQTLREWRAGAPGRIVAATFGGKGSELICGFADERVEDDCLRGSAARPRSSAAGNDTERARCDSSATRHRRGCVARAPRAGCVSRSGATA